MFWWWGRNTKFTSDWSYSKLPVQVTKGKEQRHSPSSWWTACVVETWKGSVFIRKTLLFHSFCLCSHRGMVLPGPNHQNQPFLPCKFEGKFVAFYICFPWIYYFSKERTHQKDQVLHSCGTSGTAHPRTGLLIPVFFGRPFPGLGVLQSREYKPQQQ